MKKASLFMGRILMSVLTAVILTALFSSCTTVYVPNEIHTPIFKKEHEFKGGISYGTNGFNMMLGYSPIKRLAFLGSVQYMDVNTNNKAEFHKYGELGAGYFESFHKNFSGEIFAGIGFGKGDSRDSSVLPVREKGNFHKIFTQGNFSMRLEWMELILSARVGYINFTSYTNFSVAAEYLDPAAICFEPALTFRLGPESVKFKYQVGIVKIARLTDELFGYETFFSTAGINIGF